ncbi:hypothetical protein CLOP_g18760 [Closterium sp. NIES-67]|nr:hypothetical protein CLOP_g18760 [Closterium sp. NIES-67]
MEWRMEELPAWKIWSWDCPCALSPAPGRVGRGWRRPWGSADVARGMQLRRMHVEEVLAAQEKSLRPAAHTVAVIVAGFRQEVSS